MSTFVRETVNENDLAYYLPINSDSPKTWKNADKRLISKKEIDNKTLKITGKPNQSYSVRIYSDKGADYFVKRIIGIPGDTIKIENGRVYLKTPEDKDFTEIEEEYEAGSAGRDHDTP